MPTGCALNWVVIHKILRLSTPKPRRLRTPQVLPKTHPPYRFQLYPTLLGQKYVTKTSIPSDCGRVPTSHVGIRLDRYRHVSAQELGMVPICAAKPFRGSKGNVVRADPNRSPKTTAAPATVSGECASYPLRKLGKGTQFTMTREPGDLPC